MAMRIMARYILPFGLAFLVCFAKSQTVDISRDIFQGASVRDFFVYKIPVKIHISEDNFTIRRVIDSFDEVWKAEDESSYCKYLWVYFSSTQSILLELLVVDKDSNMERISYQRDGYKWQRVDNHTFNAAFYKVKLEVSQEPVGGTDKQGHGDWSVCTQSAFIGTPCGTGDKRSESTDNQTAQGDRVEIPEGAIGTTRGQEKLARQTTPEFKRPEVPPKYFGIDFDETFYIHDKKAFEKNIEAFSKVRKMGYIPFICTARPLETVMRTVGADFVARTGYEGFPGIYLSGSVVYDVDGQILHLSKFSREFIDAFIKYIEEHNIKDQCVFYDTCASYALVDPKEVISRILVIDNIPYPKIATAKEIISMDIISIVTTNADVDIPNATKDKDFSSRCMGNNYLAEICPITISKVDAIKILMEKNGENHSAFGFIGDGLNDIEAMDLSEISFAVANAAPEVKKHATWVLSQSYLMSAFAIAMELVYNI